MKLEASIEDYWRALDRIIRNVPVVVVKGAKITNDLVSLEAGRKKGSIKKSREQFKELIAAIEAESYKQNQSLNKPKHALTRSKEEYKALRDQLDAALGRELSLLLELFEVKQKLSALTGQNIIPLRNNIG